LVDGSFYEFGIMPSECEERDPKTYKLLQSVKDGLSTTEIIDESPSFAFKSKDIDTLREAYRAEQYMTQNRELTVTYLYGSTGSGKSVLLKLLLMQAVKKDAVVIIADFKGGVDFPSIWHSKCKICFDEDHLIEILTGLAEELQRRKVLLRENECNNIDEYNKRMCKALHRYTFACDEVAEILDKTGLTKEQKDKVSLIESKLSAIARQGRAFGIHLILATQRPDANILSGQIRNNIDCRVCGRADNVLSQIILDSTDAAELIPKDAAGRFLLHDGTIFQAYLFDESNL